MKAKIKPSLLLMRHGQTNWNKTGQLTSRSDIELSEFGVEQCLNSAKKNHKYPISKIICSPKQRAMTTASIFSEHLDTRPEIIIDKNLIEIDFGIFEGQSGSDILNSKNAKPYKKWLLGHNLPDSFLCESWSSVEIRANNIFNQYKSLDETVLLISHGYFLRLFIARCVLGLELSRIRCLRLDNCKFASIEWENELSRLTSFNISNLDEIQDDTPTS